MNFAPRRNFDVDGGFEVVLAMTTDRIDQARGLSSSLNCQFVRITYPLATLTLQTKTHFEVTTERGLVMDLPKMMKRAAAYSGV